MYLAVSVQAGEGYPLLNRVERLQPLALPLWNPLGKDMVSRVPFVLVTAMITQVVKEVNRYYFLS